jgi:hypothetical protein
MPLFSNYRDLLYQEKCAGLMTQLHANTTVNGLSCFTHDTKRVHGINWRLPHVNTPAQTLGPDQVWGPLNLLRYRGSFPGVNRPGMMLTTHLQLVPR